MRYLLDSHLADAKIGVPLQRRCRALAATQQLERLSDMALFDMATRQDRILITRNVKDFLQLLGWRSHQSHHIGLILIPHSIHRNDVDIVVRGVDSAVVGTTSSDWAERVFWLKPDPFHDLAARDVLERKSGVTLTHFRHRRFSRLRPRPG